MSYTDYSITADSEEFKTDWGPDKWRHKLPNYRTDVDWDEARLVYDSVPQDRRIVADKLFEAGFGNRATRYALCGLIARRLECKNKHQFLGTFRCGLRCCQQCVGRNAQKIYAKHLKLEKLCRRVDYDLTLIEITIHNPKGRFPEAWVIEQMNREAKAALHSLFGKVYKYHGSIFFEQFVPNSPDLRVRILVYGPERPLGQFENAWRKAAHLAKSEVVCIRSAKNLRQGLSWVNETILPQLGEPLDPDWLAGVEVAFQGVRRLHALGIFHNPETEEEQDSSTGSGGGGSSTHSESTDSKLFEEDKDEEDKGLKCPICGEPLHPVGDYEPLEAFRERDLVDIEAYSSGQARAVGRAL